jgi:hypothetical protein
MKVSQLLSSPARWTRGAAARTSSGDGTSPHDPKACRWCLIGAVQKCYPRDAGRIAAWNAIFAAIGKVIRLSQFNDANKFADIRRIVRKAKV